MYVYVCMYLYVCVYVCMYVLCMYVYARDLGIVSKYELSRITVLHFPIKISQYSTYDGTVTSCYGNQSCPTLAM